MDWNYLYLYSINDNGSGNCSFLCILEHYIAVHSTIRSPLILYFGNLVPKYIYRALRATMIAHKTQKWSFERVKVDIMNSFILSMI